MADYTKLELETGMTESSRRLGTTFDKMLVERSTGILDGANRIVKLFEIYVGKKIYLSKVGNRFVVTFEDGTIIRERIRDEDISKIP